MFVRKGQVLGSVQAEDVPESNVSKPKPKTQAKTSARPKSEVLTESKDSVKSTAKTDD